MNLTTQNPTEFDFQDYTVLIVDDTPTNLGVIADYIKNYGFQIMMACSGEIALKRVQYARPDIILLDVMMPGIDGFETCRRLKADETTQDIPVIFMTALVETQHKVKGFEVGAVDYVTKPLQQEEVLARITTHLRLRDLTQNLQEKNTHLQKVTDELQETNEVLFNLMDQVREANARLSKKALQLETSNQVGQQVTSILDLDKLLGQVVALIQARFGYYFVGVWLLAEQQEAVVLRAGSGGETGPLIEPGFSIPVNTDHSIIVEVCRTGQAYLTNDVQTDARYLFLEDLPKTRSELVLPLHIGREIIGVLDIQSQKEAAFDDDDKAVLQTLANQIAIAIRNAQLYKLEEERVRDLAELNATKDKFFSIVAHDLKGPFNPLLGMAKLLSLITDTASRPEIQEMADSIHRSAKNVYSLLENLLQWSQIERGRMVYQPTRLDLKQVIEQTVELLAKNAAVKRVNLQNSITEAMWVHADENMLCMVIRNLISNALKFTPSGGHVIISVGASNPSPEFVEVSVSDTGVGISPEDLNKLFKLEFHHTTKGTAQEKGTGLGLIICQEMVAKNGGKIWVESKPSQGTTVRFTVPVAGLGGCV